MSIDNLKKLNNKKRIRSKKLLNLFDLIQLELNQLPTINFSFTILTGFFNDKKISLEEAWKSLPTILKILKNLLYKKLLDKTLLSISSIEKHRDKISLENKKGFNMYIKKNELTGYPHVHVFSSFLTSSPEDFSFDRNNIEKIILNEFINYDIKVNSIFTNKNHIKNSIKYLFKEYKLTDTDTDLISNNFSSCKIVATINLNNNSFLKTIFEEILNIVNKHNKNMSLILDDNILINPIRIKDPLYLIEILFINYLKKNDLKIEKDTVYSRSSFLPSKHYYYEIYSFEEALLHLAHESIQHRNLIISNMKKFLLLQKTTNFLDNISISDFEYIEYKEFALNLNKCRIISKDMIDTCSFNFFNQSNEELLLLNDNVDLLSTIFENDLEFFNYLRQLGSLLIHAAPKKGSAMYVYGPSNTGKSLITEKFLIEIFGEKNIGILNFSNPKYLLSQAKDKHILILNEFKYSKSLREILLKILDGSLVEINEKYKNSTKTSIKSKSVAVSNYSLKDQGMLEEAFSNRFHIIKTSCNITPQDYNLILKGLPLVILYAFHSLLSLDLKSTKASIFNLLEGNSKRIVSV